MKLIESTSNASHNIYKLVLYSGQPKFSEGVLVLDIIILITQICYKI